STKKYLSLFLVIVLLIPAVGCPAMEPESETSVDGITTASSEVKEGLKLEISLPKVSYQPGEELKATLSLINTTPKEISFSTRTSQLFDLMIKAPERELLWSEDKMFLQVITPRHIPANEALSQVLSWEINLTPGDVYLTGITVPFDLNGERIWLKTTPLKIKVN
ncbi:BsuPI-related putative proteinase inhibitor, partial [Dehalococcoidales bacterium]|nr:BsuPI-related putative proteinase inhibitor [Dehalococcoidales bacterium]